MRKVLQVMECGGKGGATRQVLALCRAGVELGVETTLAYNVRPGTAPEEIEGALPDGVRSVRIPEMVRPVSPLRDLAALRRLLRLVRETRPDVLHAHSSKAGVLGRLAGLLAGVPVVLYSPRGYGFLQRDSALPVRALYWLFELAASWIGTIVALSESEARLARRLSWGRRVEVVHDLVLEDLPEPPEPDGRGAVVASLGRLTAARAPETFVRVAARVSRERPEARFVWIGGGELEGRAKDLAERLSAPIEWTGWLPRAEALDRMAAADLVVHASLWEGLPNAVLEAQALAKPVVATDVVGNRDAVADGETGFLARSEDELVRRVGQLLADPDLRVRLGRAGRERVRTRFSREAWIGRLRGLYL